MTRTNGREGERIVAAADAFLLDHIARGRFPSASYAVGTSRGLLAQNAHGFAVVEPERIPAETTTIYDIASLTKPLITTTLALLLEQRGDLDLSSRVADVVPELDARKRHLTYIDLLTHRSGLPAWWAFFARGGDEASYLRTVIELPLEYETGTRVIYSDCGFILLYLALQRIVRGRLRVLAKEWLFEPLRLTDAMFSPPASLRRRIAATDRGTPTERQLAAARSIECTFREELIWGEVNDGNSWGLGGFAGNAGLFATARDIYLLSREYTDTARALNAESRERALQNYTAGLDENRALGWQLPGDQATHPARPLSPRAFGHTGFTGTSSWIDPEHDLIIVLLTNRTHPQIVENSMQSVRRAFHETVVRALEGV